MISACRTAAQDRSPPRHRSLRPQAVRRRPGGCSRPSRAGSAAPRDTPLPSARRHGRNRRSAATRHPHAPETTRPAPRRRRFGAGDLAAIDQREVLTGRAIAQQIARRHRSQPARAIAGKHRNDLHAEQAVRSPRRHQQQRRGRAVGCAMSWRWRSGTSAPETNASRNAGISRSNGSAAAVRRRRRGIFMRCAWPARAPAPRPPQDRSAAP